MTPKERWFAALWPLVRSRLPQAPAHVLEIGCGPLGGFVPMLLASGYEALGVDPEAPEGVHYLRSEFERAELPDRVDAVVACTSLHHVADPAVVVARIADFLGSDGAVVVVEWDWERFDEATARWCFERLGPPERGGWLHRHRALWQASGEDWETYLRQWAQGEGLHAGDTLLRLLDRQFERTLLERGPYLFPDLVDTDEQEERDAIEAGRVRAIRIDYVGRPRR